MKSESEEGNSKSEIYNLMIQSIQNEAECCSTIKDLASKNNNISKKAEYVLKILGQKKNIQKREFDE